MKELDYDSIRQLLRELADELAAHDTHADLFLVGGAAMALAYNTRRTTRDLDAVFVPKATVYDAARVVGERHGLEEGWLNDAVKGFVPGDDPNATVFLDTPGLSVRVASPRFLFAMKAAAARAERDTDDLAQLYVASGFQSISEALESIESYYPAWMLSPKTRFVLEELLSPSVVLGAENAGDGFEDGDG